MLFCHPRFDNIHCVNIYEKYPRLFIKKGENRRRGYIFYDVRDVIDLQDIHDLYDIHHQKIFIKNQQQHMQWIVNLHNDIHDIPNDNHNQDNPRVLMEWKDDGRGFWILEQCNESALQAWISQINHISQTSQTTHHINHINHHELRCPITQEAIQDPVLLAGDGHTYERQAVLRWLSENPRSPVTGLPLTEPGACAVYPNMALRR